MATRSMPTVPVATGVAGDDHLGAHAVGRGHQDRRLEAGEVERELAPEPADAGHHVAQALDGGVTGRDVHTGAGIGGAALTHDGQTPGSAAWCGVMATGSGRRNVTDSGGMGVG